MKNNLSDSCLHSTYPLILLAVSIILQIIYDIRFFLLVLVAVLIGFAQAFWVMSNETPYATYGTPWKALLNAYMNMLGQNIIEFKDGNSTAEPISSTLLLVTFMAVMMIVLMNVLVALMGETFNEVRSKGHAQWRLEQAGIILEQRFLLTEPQIQIPAYVHVLQYTSDLSPHNDGNDMKSRIREQVKLLKARRDRKSEISADLILSEANKRIQMHSRRFISGPTLTLGSQQMSQQGLGGPGQNATQLVEELEGVLRMDMLGLDNSINELDRRVQHRVSSMERYLDRLTVALERIERRLAADDINDNSDEGAPK